VSVLLTHLLARAVRGRATDPDQRVLAYLADPSVNRRVFGLPLPTNFGYYGREYACLVTASERFARTPTPDRS
jgi:hypothetical protein